MGLPIPIRDDLTGEDLRRLARRETNGRVASRLLALDNALAGMVRGQAAPLAGMDGLGLAGRPARRGAPAAE